MKHPSEYRNQEVVVLGLAKSGQAVAKVFHEFGAKVIVNDKKAKDDCPEADELEALGIHVVYDGHPDSLIHSDVQLIVKNPGIPYSISPLVKAAELGIEVVTEVEVAYFLCPGPIIGITGSNGKTTTTTWIGQILEAAGLHPIVAGNIGRPLCDTAKDNKPDEWLVVELSSFQLKGTDQFRPRIACLLNIYDTHLDFHGSKEDYAASKARLFANQNSDDIAVVNWDDPLCRKIADGIRSKLFPFSSTEKLSHGVFIEDGMIVFCKDGSEKTLILPISELGIAGKHNLENALAATAVSVMAGVDAVDIALVLRSFRGVEHRQEFVRSIDGIRFYNDSKATNPAASIKAIEAFDAPIVWIGGGLDRGFDYKEFLPLFAQKVKAVVLMGETRFKLQRAAEIAGMRTIEIVDTADNVKDMMDRAVKLAYDAAQYGDVVLFSPANASWDMFSSYEQRGSMFKSSVHNL